MNQSSELFKYYYNNYVSEEQLRAQQKAYLSQNNYQQPQQQLQKRNYANEYKKQRASPYQKNYPKKHKQVKKKYNKYVKKQVDEVKQVRHGRYTSNLVFDLLRKSEKNPIALLHEYSSRVRKGIIYNFSIKH